MGVSMNTFQNIKYIYLHMVIGCIILITVYLLILNNGEMSVSKMFPINVYLRNYCVFKATLKTREQQRVSKIFKNRAM